MLALCTGRFMRRLGLVAHIEAPFSLCRTVHTTVALAIVGPEMNDTSDEAVTDEPSAKLNDTRLDTPRAR
jgi:hypothetical protein